MTDQEYLDRAIKAIHPLLQGGPPNGIQPEDCGPWTDFVAALFAAYGEGGIPAFQKAFSTLLRKHPDLAAAFAGDRPDPAPAASLNLDDCPALPDAARLPDHLGTDACPWLDHYVAFASDAAPMTPRLFHESAGLFVGSLAIARRLKVSASTETIYPNLLVMWLARSTMYRKSTGLNVAKMLIDDANIGHLRLPERFTPQSLVVDLTTAMQQGLEYDPDWLQERAFAAQRGLVLDEGSFLFDGLKRDYNAGLLALLLRLYDCVPKEVDSTISRGRSTIHDAYFGMLSASTPSEMHTYISQERYWLNGMWARFGLLTPDNTPVIWRFFPDAISIPASIIAGIKRVYELFPIPIARVEKQSGAEDEKPRMEIVLDNQHSASSAHLEPGVWQAWEAYAKALHEMIAADQIDEELTASYGRLHIQAMKVAMILATFDADHLPVNVTRDHYGKAQRIVETWRASLHRVYRSAAKSDDLSILNRVLSYVVAAGEAGCLTKNIQQHATRTDAQSTRAILQELVLRGDVSCERRKARNGKDAEYWVVKQGSKVAE